VLHHHVDCRHRLHICRRLIVGQHATLFCTSILLGWTSHTSSVETFPPAPSVTVMRRPPSASGVAPDSSSPSATSTGGGGDRTGASDGEGGELTGAGSGGDFTGSSGEASGAARGGILLEAVESSPELVAVGISPEVEVGISLEVEVRPQVPVEEIPQEAAVR
jgi:hypothetical protein